MSNWKFAYGWSGHILVPEYIENDDKDNNVTVISIETFNAIYSDYYEEKLDERITVKRLGVLDDEPYFLAAGCCFSEGFKCYGAVFEEAELRSQSGPGFIDHDSEYLNAMEEIYLLKLPPCRLMIGCSSEN